MWGNFDSYNDYQDDFIRRRARELAESVAAYNAVSPFPVSTIDELAQFADGLWPHTGSDWHLVRDQVYTQAQILLTQ